MRRILDYNYIFLNNAINGYFFGRTYLFSNTDQYYNYNNLITRPTQISHGLGLFWIINEEKAYFYKWTSRSRKDKCL